MRACTVIGPFTWAGCWAWELEELEVEEPVVEELGAWGSLLGGVAVD
jgi:hypothetical protein